MTSRILLRRGTAAQWASANPILGSGELGVETDTLKFKIGNGTSTWTQLTSYANTTPSDLTSAINGLINAAPSALDTLNELAAAINNDSSFSTTVNNLLSGKVSKSGGDIITAATASTTPLAIRGAASQTADLLVWQNNSGTTIGRISSNGVLINQFNYFQNVQSLGGGSGLYLDGSSTIAFNTAPSQVVFKVAGYASQTADLQQWVNSAGTVLAKVNSSGDFVSGNNTFIGAAYGQIMVRGANDYGASVNISTGYLGTVGIIVRGVASQSADLQQWQNSAGTVLAKIDATGSINAVGLSLNSTVSGVMFSVDPTYGNITSRNGAYGYSGSASLSIGTNYTAQPAIIASGYPGQSVPTIIIKSVTSQTANLQEWQNSSGTVLSNITTDGWFETNNGNGIRFYGPSRTAWSTLANNLGNLGFNYAFTVGNSGLGANLGTLTSYAISASTIGLVIRGAASQTANLQEWQRNDGFVLLKVSSSGDVTAGAGSSTAIRFRYFDGINITGTYWDTVETDSATFIGRSTTATTMVVRGSASQTADILQIQDSSGTARAIFERGGALSVQPSTALNGYTGFFKSPSAAAAGLMVRGAASQTANLQEWQDSTGTVMAKISSGGDIYAVSRSVLARFVQADSGAGTYIDLGFNNVNSVSIVGRTSTTAPQLIVKGIASQTGDLQQWQDSTGYVRARVESNGAIYAPYFTNQTNSTNAYIDWTGNTLIVANRGASVTPFTIKGAASQTADLQQWQNSAGGSVARISAYGDLYIPDSRIALGSSSLLANTFLFVNTSYPSYVPIVARGAASQTANLQEWQNSAGSVYSAVEASGKFFAQSISTNSTGNSAGVFLGDYNGGGYIRLKKATAGASTANNLTQYFLLDGTTTGTLKLTIQSSGALETILDNISTTGSVPTATISAAGMILTSPAASSTVAVVKGAASQTANLQEWQNSSGTALGSFNAYGSLYVSNIVQSGTAQFGNTGYASASQVVLAVKGFASQTADLQQWQDSAGSVLARVDNSGVGSFYGIKSGYYNFNGVSYNGISNPLGFTTLPTIVIKGLASQTADLQQWQDSAGTVLAKVTASGGFELNGKDIEIMNIMGAF